MVVKEDFGEVTDTPTVAGRRVGRPARIGRDQILRTALELADERGLDALTMRALAERLGAKAMSLYRHVRDKDDLLDGLVDLVYAEIELPPRGTDWPTAMRHRALSVRRILIQHPWALALMESRRTPGPANLGHHDAVLALLLDAGASGPTATRAYNLLDSYIYGFVLQEQTLPVATPEALAETLPILIEELPAEAYPHLRVVGEELVAVGFDYGAEFEAGLDLILEALERLLGAPPLHDKR
jgi:AcrR family transcriptional regulator